ncbi:pyrroline-5-carboxylate reductase [Kordiimonas sp.]|uniref:pyrroline-5-carboxylate reductase n=1 Tax=Kordiimonas sp. TaxID=1970157 RepID=UPI003A8D2E25
MNELVPDPVTDVVDLPSIAFIGGGNMASAIIGGLVAQDFAAADIIVANPGVGRRLHLAEKFGVRTTDSAADAVASAPVVVLAVKPDVLGSVLADIAAAGRIKGRLFISIVAGKPVKVMEKALGDEAAIVRTMPNMPVLVGSGATGLYANRNVSEDQLNTAIALMSAVGICVPLDDEAHLDTVTALSGTGPAYFFLLMEEMIKAGKQLGLDHDTARALTLQTALGAAELAVSSDENPASLRARVTSPNGTTEQAIGSLVSSGFGPLIEQAIRKAKRRVAELAGS